MKNWPWLVLLLVVLAVVIAAVKGKGRGESASKEVRSKQPLTPREQSMYFRLCTTFPELVVLSQVAFSALITTKAGVSKRRSIRNGFDRKVADFVLCTKAFVVLAVIELDDSSHKGREVADTDRDAWLKDAGYKVVRYPQIPDAEKLLADFASTPSGQGAS